MGSCCINHECRAAALGKGDLSVSLVARYSRRCMRLVRLAGWSTALLVLSLLTVNAAHAETHAVVVNGLGGEERYSEAFSNAAESYTRALQTLDNGGERIVRLDESATRDSILAAIRDRIQAMDSSASATLVVILVGHGTADGSTWRFNITGPDLTTEDLVEVLNGMVIGSAVVDPGRQCQWGGAGSAGPVTASRGYGDQERR